MGISQNCPISSFLSLTPSRNIIPFPVHADQIVGRRGGGQTWTWTDYQGSHPSSDSRWPGILDLLPPLSVKCGHSSHDEVSIASERWTRASVGSGKITTLSPGSSSPRDLGSSRGYRQAPSIMQYYPKPSWIGQRHSQGSPRPGLGSQACKSPFIPLIPLGAPARWQSSACTLPSPGA